MDRLTPAANRGPGLIHRLSAKLRPAHVTPATISLRQFAVHGITLGSSVAEVEAAFGSPDSHSNGRSSLEQLTYPGVVVLLDNGKVVQLWCATSRYATPDGVRVGDTQDNVKKALGPAPVERSSGKSIIRYQVANSETDLTITVRNGKVQEILLFYR